MRLFFRISIIIFIVSFLNTPVLAQPYTGPDDERAVQNAEKAAKKLGPDRGAISIIRLDSAISGDSTGISKTLRDLGARQVGREIHVTLSGDVLFDFDKWTIKKKAESTLHKLAVGIKELNKKHVIIEGHTDSMGLDSYNLDLSQKRAEAVREWFISKDGMKGIEFQTKGYGESKPVAHNTKPDGSDNPEGRALNRRVEIRIFE